MKENFLINIANKYGSPIYIHDANIISAQYKRLFSSFSKIKSLKICYAAKSLSNISVLSYIQSLGAGLDTVSVQEVKLGIKAGFDPDMIIYTPNGVSLEEIEEVSSMGVRVNIDNLSLLEQFGAKHPKKPVCVRINPHIMAGGNNKISVGHIDSKFGISVHQIPHILRIIKNTKMKINGIHMHTGSDILDIDVFLNASEILFETAKNFKNLEFIDFGSGFKVPYFEGDVETNIEELGLKLTKKFKSFCKEYGQEIELVFEPGKFLVSQAGYFIAKVNAIKQTTSTVFAHIDSGFNHLIRPMLYGSHHEIENISNPKGKKRFYSIVGYICETDTFGNNRKISEISEDDYLLFKNSGAYCFNMSSNYNSRYRPAEVLIIEDKSYLIRKRETFKDLLRNQIKIEFPDKNNS